MVQSIKEILELTANTFGVSYKRWHLVAVVLMVLIPSAMLLVLQVVDLALEVYIKYCEITTPCG